MERNKAKLGRVANPFSCDQAKHHMLAIIGSCLQRLKFDNVNPSLNSPFPCAGKVGRSTRVEFVTAPLFLFSLFLSQEKLYDSLFGHIWGLQFQCARSSRVRGKGT